MHLLNIAFHSLDEGGATKFTILTGVLLSSKSKCFGTDFNNKAVAQFNPYPFDFKNGKFQNEIFFLKLKNKVRKMLPLAVDCQ